MVTIPSPNVVIFDLDGTLADVEHRRHWLDPAQHAGMAQDERWRRFFADCVHDTPRERVVAAAKALFEAGLQVVILSARSDEVKRETLAWLHKHGIPFDELRMRKAGDRTPDETLKSQWLADFDPADILCVFDDRPVVIRMWRAAGLLVADCGDGKEF